MLILYTTDDGKSQIQLLAKDQTVWLTQREMAELFAVSTDNVSLHLKNIFADGELDEGSVTEDSSETAADGKNYRTKLYQLDAILAVGGGSVIDTAKVVAVCLTLGGDLLDYQGLNCIERKLVPLVVVPTTAGTGSTKFAHQQPTSSKRRINKCHPLLNPSAPCQTPRACASWHSSNGTNFPSTNFRKSHGWASRAS